MRVFVKVPPDSDTPNGQSSVWYQVTLKMFWYRSDGSIKTKVSHLMNDMHVIVDGDEEYIDSACPGLARAFFN